MAKPEPFATTVGRMLSPRPSVRPSKAMSGRRPALSTWRAGVSASPDGSSVWNVGPCSPQAMAKSLPVKASEVLETVLLVPVVSRTATSGPVRTPWLEMRVTTAETFNPTPNP